MDPILNAIKVVSPAPMPRKSADVAAVPMKAAKTDVPLIAIGGGEVTVADAERKREEVVQRAASRLAVLPTTFVMFKGTNGEIITRFRDGNTGKVTYIPEPQLLQMSQASSIPNLVLEA